MRCRVNDVPFPQLKVCTLEGSSDNYSSQDQYRTEIFKPFIYDFACELIRMMVIGGTLLIIL